LEQLAAAAGAQVAGEGGGATSPAGGFGGGEPAEQLAELEQGGFGAAGEGLGFAGVVGGEQGLGPGRCYGRTMCTCGIPSSRYPSPSTTKPKLW
jgi:hypothetical protein